MIPDQAIATIKARLYNWNGSNIDSIIESELQLAQIRLESGPLYPWFLLEDKQDISLAANTESVAVPTGFIAEWDELRPGAMWYQTTPGKWKRLTKSMYDDMLRVYVESGEPRAYTLIGDLYYFRPIPTTTTTLRLIYFKQDNTIVQGGTENGWLKYAPDLIIGLAGRTVARQYANMEAAAQAFEAMAAEAQQRLIGLNAQRIEAAMNRMVGGNY